MATEGEKAGSEFLQSAIDGVIEKLADASEISTTGILTSQETERLFQVHLLLVNRKTEYDRARGI
ncbi:hypothetical protein K2X83_01120 [Patescibacteria group bacterium]|nr:hypothetical protein [Patescibacteria group bacterium]